MTTSSNYPRSWDLITIDTSLLAKRGKSVLAGCFGLFFVDLCYSVFEDALGIRDDSASAFFAILMVVAIISCWVYIARYVRQLGEFVSTYRRESMLLSPRKMGFWSGFPVGGTVVLSYFLEYVLLRTIEPPQKSMRWYSVASRSRLGTMLVYAASVSLIVDFLVMASFIPPIPALIASKVMNLVFITVLGVSVFQVQKQVEALAATSRRML